MTPDPPARLNLPYFQFGLKPNHWYNPGRATTWACVSRVKNMMRTLARVQGELRLRGMAILKSKSPADRTGWLKTSEAISAIGAQEAHRLRQALERRERKVERVVCSDAWIAAYQRDETLPPGLRWGKRDAIIPAANNKLVLSRCEISIGEAVPSRRWTPPQCVESEDALDGMSGAEAERYHHPPSPSAHAIRLFELYTPRALKRVADDRGRNGRGRTNAGKKRKKR